MKLRHFTPATGLLLSSDTFCHFVITFFFSADESHSSGLLFRGNSVINRDGLIRIFFHCPRIIEH